MLVGAPAAMSSVAESLRENGDHRVVAILQGSNMQTFAGLFDEFSRLLKFPSYFGRNFNALYDVLTDFAWLPADSYALLFVDAPLILSHEKIDPRWVPPSHIEALAGLLQRACEYWNRPIAQGQWFDRPGVPYHVVFQVTPERAPDFRDMLSVAQVPFDNLSGS